MKKIITLMAGLAAAAFTQQSLADETVHITGSSAFRSNAHAGLSGVGFTIVAFTKNSGSGGSKSNFSIWQKGSTPNKVTVKCAWNGAVGGVKAMVQKASTPVGYIPDSVIGTASATDNTLLETAANEIYAGGDLAFTDTFQIDTPYTTPALAADNIVGVVQFRMVTNYGPGGVNPIKSINYQQARQLWKSGSLPLAVLTGNAADVGTVYAIGRDPDSGTRVVFQAETGIGAISRVKHHIDVGSTATAITTLNLTPPTTLYGDPVPLGNGGYASGGNLAKAMRLDTSSVSVDSGTAGPAYLITYLSKGDADTAIGADGTTSGAGNAKLIAFEGSDAGSDSYPNVTTSVDTTNLANKVKNGSHPFWCYEHAIHNGGLGTEAAALYTALVNFMQVTAAGGITHPGNGSTVLSNMNVHRAADLDGAQITP